MVTFTDRDPRLDALAVFLIAEGLFLLASLAGYCPADPPSVYVYPTNVVVDNWCGPVGARVAGRLIELFGLAAPLTTLFFFWAGWSLVRREPLGRSLWRAAGQLLVFGALAGLFDWLPGRWSVVLPGGELGAVVTELLESALFTTGSLLILFALAAGGLLLATDARLIDAARWLGGSARILGNRLRTWRDLRRAPMGVTASTAPDAGSAAVDADWEHPRQGLRIVRNGFDRPEFGGRETRVTGEHDFRLPGLDLLDQPEPFEFEQHDETVREQAELLEKTCAEFQMNVKVVQIDTGPVLTQYEIELEPGLRARKVISLADDLAIALRAPSVRIVAPIPGKNTVGIEVPNPRRAKVTLKEVMSHAPSAADEMRLPLFLGMDVKGQPLVYDLADMPHLLIAGRTGTGKSVCLNALIVSILMARAPEQVRMLMIDPKMVELSLYKDIPHLLHPVVTDMRKAEALLAWAVDKMDERYELLASAGVRHIDSFNKLAPDELRDRLGPDFDENVTPNHLPYILIFADELADLMMTAAKEVESHIVRLAQKSRAVGIHLVVATQKPTVDVITGLIKSNLPARIAFQVASRSDSRVVLDEIGSDKLLGNGDMLLLYPGTSKITRAQGTFVSDEEVNRITRYLHGQGGPQYSSELLNLESKTTRESGSEPVNAGEKDELYEQAVEIVIREQRGSVSLLQRALGIGYGRGARLIDFMAEDGIVGQYNGSQAREVLYGIEDWEYLKRDRFGKAS